MSFDLNGGYWDSTVSGSKADWHIDASASMGLGDIASLGLAVGTGKTGHNGTKFNKGSVFLGFTLSDAVSAEMGVTYTDIKSGNDELTVAGGIYYTPVSQLTLGLEASYADYKNSHEDISRCFGIGISLLIQASA